LIGPGEIAKGADTAGDKNSGHSAQPRAMYPEPELDCFAFSSGIRGFRRRLDPADPGGQRMVTGWLAGRVMDSA
jgi:hypothetical protein